MEHDSAPADIYRHVDRVFPELRQLSESAEAVEKLARDPGFKAVQAIIEAEIASIDRKLDHAPLGEATEYAHAHGRRGALNAFTDAMQAIREGAEKRIAEDTRQSAGESAPERQVA